MGTIQPYTLSTVESPTTTDDSFLEIIVIADDGNTTFANDDAEDDEQSVTAFDFDSNGNGGSDQEVLD